MCIWRLFTNRTRKKVNKNADPHSAHFTFAVDPSFDCILNWCCLPNRTTYSCLCTFLAHRNWSSPHLCFSSVLVNFSERRQTMRELWDCMYIRFTAKQWIIKGTQTEKRTKKWNNGDVEVYIAHTHRSQCPWRDWTGTMITSISKQNNNYYSVDGKDRGGAFHSFFSNVERFTMNCRRELVSQNIPFAISTYQFISNGCQRITIII